MLSPGFSTNEPIHVTFDNSDGRQQTITCGQKLPSARIEELKAAGSWTAFSNETSHAETVKCKLEYLPVVHCPVMII